MLRVRVLGELALELDGEALPAPRGRRLRGLLGWLALHPGHARARRGGRQPVARRPRRERPHKSAHGARGAAPHARRRPPRDHARRGRPRTRGLGRRSCVRAVRARWPARRRARPRARAGARRAGRRLGLRRARSPGRSGAGRARARGRRGRGARRSRGGDRAHARAGGRRPAGRGRAPRPHPAAGRRGRSCRRAGGLRAAARAAGARARDRAVPADAGARARSCVARRRRSRCPAPLARRHRSPFVGRARALGRLRGMLGEGRVVVLSGEPGIGKTRLAAELARAAHGAGRHRPLRPRRRGRDRAVPAVRRGAAPLPRRALAGPALLGRSAGELGRLVPDQADRAAAAAAERHARSRAARATACSRPRPRCSAARGASARSLLVLDDLHWADRPTLLLLAPPAPRASSTRLLVVGTYRDGETRRDPLARRCSPTCAATGWSSASRSTASTQRSVDALVTAGSAPDAPERAAPAAAARPAATRSSSRRCCATSPTAATRRRARGRQGRARRAGSTRLGETPRDVLALAAVAGREFDLARARGGGLPRDALAGARRGARRAPDPRGARPPRVHARARARGDVRAALERRAARCCTGALAEALERRGARRRRARAPLPARGGRRRRRRSSTRRARGRRARRALRLRGRRAATSSARSRRRRERARRAAARRSATRTCGRATSRPRARRFSAAAGAARERGARELLARAALGRSGLTSTVLGHDPETVALLEEALAALGGRAGAARPAPRPPGDRALPLAAGRAARGAERAGGRARPRAGAPGALADALSARHVALWSAPHLDERLALADEMIAGAADDRERALQGRNWRVLDLLERGDVDAARAEIAEHERAGRRAAAAGLPVVGRRCGARCSRSSRATSPRPQRLRAAAVAIGRRAGDRVAELFDWIQAVFLDIEREPLSPDTNTDVPDRLAVAAVQSAFRSDLPVHLRRDGPHRRGATRARRRSRRATSPAWRAT